MSAAEGHYGQELQEFLDKRLDANVRRAVAAHLETCSECRRKRDAIAWTKEMVHLVTTRRAPDGLRLRVVGAIDAERKEIERRSNPRTDPR